MTNPALPPIDISSGIPRLDAYLKRGYHDVLGMSSRFAAAITGHVLKIQSDAGISGDIAEIGTFKGRFFIAMMLGLQPGERGLGIDSFDWPGPECYDEFIANCNHHGIDPKTYDAWKINAREIDEESIKDKRNIRKIRFFHVDGDHSDQHLSKDLELATSVLHEKGVICLDDMLHPGYPTLVLTVMRYLERHPEMRVFCIADREDIVAAAKFMIARKDIAEMYENALMNNYPQFQYLMGADFLDYGALVLTPWPRLAKVD